MALSYDAMGGFAVCDCGISSFTVLQSSRLGRERAGCFTFIDKSSRWVGLQCDSDISDHTN